MFQNDAGARVLAAGLVLAAACLPTAGIATRAWAVGKANVAASPIESSRIASDSEASNVSAARQEVDVENFAFGSKLLTVPHGATVTWVNRDSEPHTVLNSAEKPLFRSPPLDTGDRFSFTFTRAGAYPYNCSVHPHMTGTVVVR
jgi:plastocyanin